MLGLFAFVALLVGYFVANVYQVPDSATSFLFIGLMLMFLHETFGHIVADWTSRRDGNERYRF